MMVIWELADAIQAQVTNRWVGWMMIASDVIVRLKWPLGVIDWLMMMKETLNEWVNEWMRNMSSSQSEVGRCTRSEKGRKRRSNDGGRTGACATWSYSKTVHYVECCALATTTGAAVEPNRSHRTEASGTNHHKKASLSNRHETNLTERISERICTESLSTFVDCSQ